MREEAYAALCRYSAMAGQAEGVPEAVERQAARDRGQFGNSYLAYGKDGKYTWHPLPMIRFLTEVCGIPLRESREAVMEEALDTGVGMNDGEWTPSHEQARKLFTTFENILEGREYAAFLAEMFEGNDDAAAAYWNDVLNCIETLAFVPESTGAENW